MARKGATAAAEITYAAVARRPTLLATVATPSRTPSKTRHQ
jgi:hypothetical protein